MLAGSSSGVDVRYLGLDKGDASGAVAAEGSEAKTALPPFEPFSPGESGGAAHLRLRLAELQSEERKSLADSHAERELRLEIRWLEMD